VQVYRFFFSNFFTTRNLNVFGMVVMIMISSSLGENDLARHEEACPRECCDKVYYIYN